MFKRWRTAAAIGFFTATAGAALGQTADPAPGAKLAQTFCNACHQVERNTTVPSPNPDAPPFAAVADNAEMTDLAIRVFLRSPHPSMPNFLLSEAEIDSVIAYIRTLPAR